jgi:UDP-glucose 4-epimerase
MKRILVTGGAGFIGSTLAKDLLERGNQVRVLDNFSRQGRGFDAISGHPNLEVIRGDILDAATAHEVVQDCQMVIHCAAIAGIDTVIKSPTKTLRVNLIGTANMLEAAHATGGIERFIQFSTSEVFGTSAYRAGEEDDAVTGSAGEARWSYAVSKLAGEHLAQAYWTEHRFPVVTVRPFNVYGPGQIGEGALQIFIRRALRNEDLVIYGDGNQIRAWCFVEDFLRALKLTFINPDAIGESFNVGNSRAVVTIYGLANAVIRVLGSKSSVVFEPAPSADIELRVPQVEKARRLLGFEAKVDLEEGILRTAEFYRQELMDS